MTVFENRIGVEFVSENASSVLNLLVKQCSMSRAEMCQSHIRNITKS